MKKMVCALSQKSVVAIRQIDHDLIAGNFSTVDWEQLSAIASDLERLICSLGMIAVGTSEIVQVLRCVSGTAGMIPAVVIYSEQILDKEDSAGVDAVLENFVGALKGATGASNLFPDSTAALTQHQMSAIDAAGAECVKVLGRSIKHPILFEGLTGGVVAVAEGRLRPPVSQLVAEMPPRAVRATIDQLGYSNFSAQLVADSGERIDAHYENHEDFATLADRFLSRREHEFLVITRSDDRGKIRHIIDPETLREQ